MGATQVNHCLNNGAGVDRPFMKQRGTPELRERRGKEKWRRECGVVTNPSERSNPRRAENTLNVEDRKKRGNTGICYFADSLRKGGWKELDQ